MEIPLHPDVTAKLTEGRAFIDAVRAARRQITDAKLSIPLPDGDGEIVVDGRGMVLSAFFPDDIFDLYPGEELSDTLTAMCHEGYGQACSNKDAALQAIKDDCGIA